LAALPWVTDLNVGIVNDSSKIWLFDYDLTLYGEEERFVLNSLDHRIAEFVQKTVGGTFESATEIRKDYLLRFGTTLSGLMAMNGTAPDDFFDFIHKYTSILEKISIYFAKLLNIFETSDIL